MQNPIQFLISLPACSQTRVDSNHLQCKFGLCRYFCPSIGNLQGHFQSLRMKNRWQWPQAIFTVMTSESTVTGLK